MNQTFRLVLAWALAWPTLLTAQATTYNQKVEADSFVSSGLPDGNFGGAGGMEIAAPTLTQLRTEISLIRFDTAALQASMIADYGLGNWQVTAVTLTLFSNVARAGQQPNNSIFNKIAAGDFAFGLLSNNNWSETDITWNTLPSLLPGTEANTLTPLGTFYWDATGQPSSTWTLDLDALLVGEINAGGKVSLLGEPTEGSAVGYLSNTLTSRAGYLSVTVQAVPEPSIRVLIGTLIVVMVGKKLRYGIWS